ncbi:MAG: adenine deaminase [Deltaproteobacteria bacterium]|nr:adenine deaminase [Deltaproteobacteria bacterium]
MKGYSLLTTAGLDKAKKIVDVIWGREKADLVVINARVLNIYTGELLDNNAICIKGEWIAFSGDEYEETIGTHTEIIDAEGKTAIPGFIDGHTHISDWLCDPIEYLRLVLPGGTTTLITETIEPFPSAGYEGIVDFLNALADQPIKIFATAPFMASISQSIDPISMDILKKFLSRDDVLGLGESYWQAVLQDQDRCWGIFEETLRSGKRLEGHSAGARGKKLLTYVIPGISSCHEPITAEEVLERLRLGLYVMAREGSIRSDLDSISRIMDMNVDLRRLMLVSDGISPAMLMEKGCMEGVVRKAVDCGFDPVKAIQMATLNVAEYFRLDGIIGGIAPGRYADILLIPDLKTIRADYVISKGRVIARDGKALVNPRKHSFTKRSLNTVKLPRDLVPSDFSIKVDGKRSHVSVRVIDQVTDLVTREMTASVPVINGEILSDPVKDILKVAAIDRTNIPGKMFTGLVHGFNLKKGAFASSSSWDASVIITIGVSDEDMALAVNRIRSLRGGVVVCSGGKILSEIALPVFGLMADTSMESFMEKREEITETIKILGASFEDPLHVMIVLTGAAIPFIRICEYGLINMKDGKEMDLIIE